MLRLREVHLKVVVEQTVPKVMEACRDTHFMCNRPEIPHNDGCVGT